MGSSSGEIIQRHLSPNEVQRYKIFSELTSNIQIPKIASDSKTKTYIVTFDGTWEDKDASSNDKDSNVARFYNVAKNSLETSESGTAKYYRGVGTEGSVKGGLDSVLGFGIAENAEAAYKEFCQQYSQWQAADPNVQVSLSEIGFSRGSATARYFSNLIAERGIVDFSTEKTVSDFDPVTGQYTSHKEYQTLVPPGQVKIDGMFLFETVDTGNGGTKQNIPDCVKSVVQLVASDERRNDTFRLRDLFSSTKNQWCQVLHSIIFDRQRQALISANLLIEDSMPAWITCISALSIKACIRLMG